MTAVDAAERVNRRQDARREKYDQADEGQNAKCRGNVDRRWRATGGVTGSYRREGDVP
ncbi:MAG TPA: hypothetical protein PKO06_03020 [Candidatus Ozemobacteraceae bacterium]|nr:hypothetical protein [Candidatus Ozemobacteraceae bacterium]